MEQIRFSVPADPIPLARPRFSGRHCFNPTRNLEYREVVRQAAREAIGNRPPMTGEVSATIHLYRRYKANSKRYGDVDNHLKALFDALNGVAIEDDTQILRCFVEKHTDKTRPRTEVTLEAYPQVEMKGSGNREN